MSKTNLDKLRNAGVDLSEIDELLDVKRRADDALKAIEALSDTELNSLIKWNGIVSNIRSDADADKAGGFPI